MAYKGLQSFIRVLENENELIRVREFVDPVLEITEVTDRISKLPGGGKALLFENTGTPFPLLINALGSEKRMALAFGRENLQSVEEEIMALFQKLTSPKSNLWDKLKMLPGLKEVASWMPEKARGRGKCQEVETAEPDLSRLPVMKCWPADGGKFITLPAVHTVDPETGAPNVGMYRMQIFARDMTGMHWHLHKTGANHFAKHRTSGRKMPVTVTLGGDPAYIYAATAPMPENMDEYLLAGFLRKKRVRLVKCLTNDLYVPEDVDFVLEGYVDPTEDMILEGPFGDHTGFYSLADYFPRFHITCITHRKDAVYPATIVGIPPMEDAWIGKATERIFLSPIRLTMIPELTDMDLPFAGVAHNISIVKIRKSYPGQAVKVMHSLWGAGQMMFNKILIVTDDRTDDRDQVPGSGFRVPGSGFQVPGSGFQVPGSGFQVPGSRFQVPGSRFQVPGSRFQVPEQKSAIRNRQSEIGNPKSEILNVHDYSVIARLFRENFDPSRSLHFSKGPLDILDHSSRKYSYGSKLGIDLTRAFPEEQNNNHPDPPETVTVFSPELLMQTDHVHGFKNLSEEIKLPVLLLSVDKNDSFSKSGLMEDLANLDGMEQFKAVVLYDKFADLNDLFTLIWLLGGNLDPERDVSLLRNPGGHEYILADATFKTMQHDDFSRDWPNIVTMDDATIAAIDKKWQELYLGQFLPSPSFNFKNLAIGVGATARFYKPDPGFL